MDLIHNRFYADLINKAQKQTKTEGLFDEEANNTEALKLLEANFHHYLPMNKPQHKFSFYS